MKWNDIVDIVKEKIDAMKPWDILGLYMAKANGLAALSWEDQEFGIPDMDAAFMAIVEAGSFRLNMRHGELHWEFFMPKSSNVYKGGSGHKVRICWDEFVPDTVVSYTKEISIPYRDCGIEGFISVVKAEMNETMARKLAMDLVEASEEM